MESDASLALESDAPELSLADLEQQARARNGGRSLPLRDWVALAEAWRIARALREASGNRTAAARALGIGRRTLYSKLEKLGLAPVWLLSGSSPATRPALSEPRRETHGVAL
jgi:DNA-binding NtrC family response regulator